MLQLHFTPSQQTGDGIPFRVPSVEGSGLAKAASAPTASGAALGAMATVSNVHQPSGEGIVVANPLEHPFLRRPVAQVPLGGIGTAIAASTAAVELSTDDSRLQVVIRQTAMELESCRSSGNDAFRADGFAQAIAEYREGLRRAEPLLAHARFLQQRSGAGLDAPSWVGPIAQIRIVAITMLNNTALAYFRVGNGPAASRYTARVRQLAEEAIVVECGGEEQENVRIAAARGAVKAVLTDAKARLRVSQDPEGARDVLDGLRPRGSKAQSTAAPPPLVVAQREFVGGQPDVDAEIHALQVEADRAIHAADAMAKAAFKNMF